MQLYSSKVIPATEDEFWQLPPDTPSLEGAKLLVISAPFEPGSAEAQTLAKMVAACKLSPAEFVTLHLSADERLSWRALLGAGAPPRILMLGITPAQLGISALFQLNHANSFMGCTFMPSYSLAQLELQPAAKRELWEGALKPCFGL